MAAPHLRARWVRHTYRARRERMWPGLMLVGTLLGTAGLIAVDVWPGAPSYPAAFWNHPIAVRPAPVLMAGLYLSGALGLLADIGVRRWLGATILVWHWAIGLLLFTAGWAWAVGYPASALAFGWPALVVLTSIWWEPADPEAAGG